MKQIRLLVFDLLLSLFCAIPCLATDHFVSPSGGNVAPFTSWGTAATNIQDAIDAAAAGETVWVTNGLYATGGKVMAGDLTNRVVLDKALTVQSVNGPYLTIIQGAWDPTSTNGPLAVRCAWLTNGALLSGFALQGGATRNSGDTTNLQSGGGLWARSTNAIALNCMVRSNSATSSGGGAFSASLLNCLLQANSVTAVGVNGGGGGAYACNMTNCTITGNSCIGNGGGVALGNLRNCAITRNVASYAGGGFYGGSGPRPGTLINCTVSGNIASAGGPSQGGGIYYGNLTNCIVYNNLNLSQIYASSSNYVAGGFTFCCTAPLPAGSGNISTNPHLLSDGIHVAPDSPCIGAGFPVASGTDIDGQPWTNPPSIGCDEWLPSPIPLATPPQMALAGLPPALNLWSQAAGQEPFSYSWLKNGAMLEDGPKYSSAHTTNLTVNAFGPTDAGGYQLVASNAFGVATGALASVVVHCANASAAVSIPPFSDWPTAATNLQDAIDAAAIGDFVLVTNGVYATGGRVMAGDLTNRVVINLPLMVTSMNGARSTVIQGAFDPVTTNGPLAIRCAWLANRASLVGFTLQGGATRNTGDSFALQSGGGALCASTNESLLCCVLSNNSAAYYGGASCRGQLQRCILWGNTAGFGAGAYAACLTNSLVCSNSASFGGGIYECAVVHCTITANIASLSDGGGEYRSYAWNSIIFYNIAPGSSYAPYANDWDFSSRSGLVSCWTSSTTYPFIDTTFSPQLTADGFHLAATSPCRGAGNPLYSSPTDIDGEPWLNPPSMGCDEFYDADFSGPLMLGPIVAYNPYSHGPPLRNVPALVSTTVPANADRLSWSFGDGATITNRFFSLTQHTWTNVGDFNITFTVYNADYPDGVSTNLLVHVFLPDPPQLIAQTLAGTNFSFTFSTQLGVHYLVQQTTNLTPPVAWATIGLLQAFSNPWRFIDVNATNTTSFYRVLAQ